MFSLFWFALYLMDRLIHVKNDVQLSTPRGFYTTLRNLSDNSFSFSTSTSSSSASSLSTSTSSSSSSSSAGSNFKSTQPTFTITLPDGNVLDAFKTMNFHRSKMNEYLCDDFITTAKIAPIVERVLDSDTHNRNIAAKLIRDVGSNSYKTWLMRAISDGNTAEQRNSTQRQDLVQFGYAEGHFKKPFYKLRSDGAVYSNSLRSSANDNNNVQEEYTHFGMSFPAYHANRYKESSYPIYQPIHKRPSATSMTLPSAQRPRYPTQFIPNENIIGVNLHGRYMNLTEAHRKNLKDNVTPRDTFQRSDLPQNYVGQSPNKETIAIYVTQSNAPPLGQQMITEGNPYWTSDSNIEISNYNMWPGNVDNSGNMQRSPQIPAPDTNSGVNSYGGYSYTTISPSSMDNNALPYTQYYPSVTEGPTEYTYPPYYPPTDVGNAFNGYGYPDATTSTATPPSAQPLPPQFGYQPPVTSTLYGYQPQITSWPYGWPPTTSTTTSMPMIVGWMPMTNPAPAAPNQPPPPSSSTVPSMMAMIPMMAIPPTPSPVYPPTPATNPNYGLTVPAPMPMIPIYGIPPSTPPPYGYQPPSNPPAMVWPPPTSTPLPYGIEYTFNPPDNQNPHFDSAAHPPWYDQPQLQSQFGNAASNNDAPSDFTDYDSLQGSQDMQNLQDSQDPRDNAISNILGSDAYELILTAIAFLSFGSYFMNMMLQLMQGNSQPTMMIIGNGGGNSVPTLPNNEFRKFSSREQDDHHFLDEVLVSIEEFHNWLTENSTKSQ